MDASPWTRADAVTAAVLMTVGGVVWFAGWWEVSARSSMESQIAPLNVVVLGLVLIGAGQALWFLRGRQAVGDRRRLLLGAAANLQPVAAVPNGGDSFVGSERFYHRSECVMVDGRAWTPTSRAAQERAGRTPCGVCAP